MKGKYRKLIPIVLIALMVLSCYSIISQAMKKNAEYKGHIAAAKKAAKDSITVEVQSEYLKAIDMKPSMELYLELGKYYADNNLYDLGKDLGQVMTEKYPHDSRSFEYLLKNYLKLNNYEEFFDEYNHAKKLGVVNKKITELYEQSEFIYKIDFNSYLTAGVYSSSMCPVSLEDYKTGKVLYGYADEEGETAIDAKFAECGYFNSEETPTAPVIDENNEAYYINQDGSKYSVIKPEKINVKKLGMISSGVAVVQDDENYYLCNLDGEVIAGPYKYISTINGDVGVVQDNEGWKIIDNKGDFLSEEVFEGFVVDEKEISYRQDVLLAKRNNKYIIVDKKGKAVSNAEFDDAKMFIDSYAAVKVGTKWGFVDTKGKMIVEPAYEDAKSFSNSLAAVSNGSLWGYITVKDNSVKQAIDFAFTQANSFSLTKKCAFVQTDDVWKMLILYSELRG